ncbi:MotA/TolQ/ExbB proton channel family protein [Photobacterium nomapromontoriensis]|uniref:MotA/TolQ/ExbB proton channel family protein n=1 Tax=Photobacterium nomapromontoriensis TaxID=2910237 RepID=UPI003D0BC439
MLNWLQQGGVILSVLLVFAFSLVWQICDVWLRLKQTTHVLAWRAQQDKCRQLIVWVSAAPLLGLLGTVHGLLISFSVLAQGEQQLLNQGMSQALLTTEVGLAIAIPAWVVLVAVERYCQTQWERCQ